MDLATNDGKLAKIFIESHEYPLFGIRRGEQGLRLLDRSASRLPKSHRGQEPRELPSRLPRRMRPGGVSLSFGGDQRFDPLVSNELVGVGETGLDISLL